MEPIRIKKRLLSNILGAEKCSICGKNPFCLDALVQAYPWYPTVSWKLRYVIINVQFKGGIFFLSGHRHSTQFKNINNKVTL